MTDNKVDKTVKISVSLPESLLEEIDKECGGNRSAYIQKALQDKAQKLLSPGIIEDLADRYLGALACEESNLKEKLANKNQKHMVRDWLKEIAADDTPGLELLAAEPPAQYPDPPKPKKNGPPPTKKATP